MENALYYNAVIMKVIVGYKIKKFKIIVSPTHSIEWSGAGLQVWLIQHGLLAFTHHLHNCRNIIVMSVSHKRAIKKMHIEVINGHLYYLHSILWLLTRGADPDTNQSRNKDCKFLWFNTLWSHKMKHISKFVSSCVSLAVACQNK